MRADRRRSMAIAARMPNEPAAQMAKDLAEDLPQAGYTVTGERQHGRAWGGDGISLGTTFFLLLCFRHQTINVCGVCVRRKAEHTNTSLNHCIPSLAEHTAFFNSL